MRVWNPETGEVTRTLQGHAGGVSGLSLSADRSLLLSSSTVDGRAVLWELESGVERQRFGGGGDHLWAARLSADGGTVLGGGVLAVTLFEAESGSVERRLEGFSHGIQNVSFSHDGSRVLVSDLAFGVHLWNLEAGARDTRLSGMFAAFAAQAGYAVTVDPGGTQAEIWDATADTLLRRIPIDEGPLIALAVSPDGRRIATRGASDSDISLWDSETGASLGSLSPPDDAPVQTLTFLPGGDRLVTGGDGVRVWDVEAGTLTAGFEGVVALDVAAFPDGRRVLICAGDLVRVLELETGAVRVLEGHTDFVNAVAVSPDGRYAASGGRDRTVRVWDVTTGEAIHVMRGHDDAIMDVAFSPDGAHLLTGSRDGTARLWDVGTGVELASLVAFSDGTWIAVAPDGRFDTDELEEIQGVHWVMPDAPFEPLPIEIFMRDYFEPRLVGRLMEREEMAPVPDLSAVNRVQPEIALVTVETGFDGSALITVRVTEGRGYARTGADSTLVRSGAHDLRLFRDGQLVAWKDGPLELAVGGTVTVRFDGIRLPRRGDAASVDFSAYAFNDDRVKSPTARTSLELPADLVATRGRAYVITVGVDAYESPAWDLRFAANDAWLLSRDLVARLAGSSSFDDVMAVPLISAHEPSQSTVATKASIRGVLDLLAGRDVSTEVRDLIPGADRISAATPDELVFLSFSAHGYRDPDGTFYLLPADIGRDAQKRVTPDLLQRAISSEELTEWLRSIDAGEIVLVVDACHSAAAVEGVGFKPGPMGSRGLGQLAYDKGMRVLAASQAEDVALESDLIRQGLLTYALVRDGLEAGQADRRPLDGIITLSEWLRYGVDRVPTLYREVQQGDVQTFGLAGRSIEIGGRREDPDFQQPSLFDFRRGGIELSLTRN